MVVDHSTAAQVDRCACALTRGKPRLFAGSARASHRMMMYMNYQNVDNDRSQALWKIERPIIWLLSRDPDLMRHAAALRI